MIWLIFLLLALLPCSAQQNSFADLAFMQPPISSVSTCAYSGLLIWDSGNDGIKFSNADVTDVTTNVTALNCYYNESTLYYLADDGDNDVSTISNLVTLPALTNFDIGQGGGNYSIFDVEGGHLTNVYWLQALNITDASVTNIVVKGMTNLVKFYWNANSVHFFNIDGCYNLVDISTDGGLTEDETTYYFTNLDAMGASNGTISLNGSVPTSEGMTASNNLVGKGWTINP